MNANRKDIVHSAIYKTIGLTALALIAFAANSVLCRMALGEGAIDAASFTGLRLLAGVLVLWVIITLRKKPTGVASTGSWFASAMLFVYAIAFSFAYMRLDTATGALILFGAVQISMIVHSFFAGNRLSVGEWTGLLIAFAGFVLMLLPGINTPPLIGFLLMAAAGVAWGVYSVLGRSSMDALNDTAYNFLRSLPWLALVALWFLAQAHFSLRGIILAVLSGGLASGVGYTIWYMALRGLSSAQAAVVQLLVPVIAALGGVLIVGEFISQRLLYSSALVLGGILLVVLSRKKLIQVSGEA